MKNIPAETQQALLTYYSEQETLDIALSDLGVRKIDPNSPDDVDKRNRFSSEASDPTVARGIPPDFTAFSQAYSVYIYDGTYAYNNVTDIFGSLTTRVTAIISTGECYRQVSDEPMAGQLYTETAFQRAL